MNKAVRYWVRRLVISFPLWLALVHETDTRRFDNGQRVFGDHQGMVLWGLMFILLWVSLDLYVQDMRASQRETKEEQ
jgi:hypothetical protein